MKTKFTTTKYSKNYGDDIPFISKLVTEDNKPLIGKKIEIEANGITYNRTTDTNGEFKLNINWLPVKRNITQKFNGDQEYEPCTTTAEVEVKKIATRMEGTEVNKTLSQKTQYQCAVYDHNGRIAGQVNITINGITYPKTPDITGLYKLNINLPVGTYKVTAEYVGSEIYKPSSITNTVKVVADPKPQCNSPWSQTPLLLQNKPGSLGQVTPYSCGPHSLMQAFYHLTGIDVAESTIMSWAGTTTSGTGHQGLNTAVAMFNKKYNQNIKIKWCNLSDFGSTVTEQFRNIGKLKCEGKYVFFHLLYQSKYGHYETYKTNHGVDTRFDIANSLGSRKGNGYNGYIENRTYARQKQYISGISQPSVAVLWR